MKRAIVTIALIVLYLSAMVVIAVTGTAKAAAPAVKNAQSENAALY